VSLAVGGSKDQGLPHSTILLPTHGDGRRSGIFHGDLLSAVGGLPQASVARQVRVTVEGGCAMAGGVGYRVEYAEGRTAAGVAGGGRIKGPGLPHSTILLPAQVMVGGV